MCLCPQKIVDFFVTSVAFVPSDFHSLTFLPLFVSHLEQEEEDAALKRQLELLVERIQDADEHIQRTALDALGKEIKTSTSSMTSVPKPLKYLKPQYDNIKQIYERTKSNKVKKEKKKERKKSTEKLSFYNSFSHCHLSLTSMQALFSDILSVLAMTMAKAGTRESLKFKLAGTKDAIGVWGHEYVRYFFFFVAI
jgi:26S proteasome regulatory subunit N1